MSSSKANRKVKEPKQLKEITVQKLTSTAAKEFYDNPTPAGEKPNLDEFPDKYSPPRVECAWESWWEKQKYFESHEGRDKKFVMILPPPNVTGYLHLGHALVSSIEDTLTRFYRMNGYDAVWIPGTDHAGIATQVRVEKKIFLEKGLTRNEISRELFMKEANEWVADHGGQILVQLRRIGVSLDWSRYYFTLDDTRSKAVTEAFIRLFNKGKIYRQQRLVNWDSALQTAISDAEVEYIDVHGSTMLSVPGHAKKCEFGIIEHFYYQIADENGQPTDEKIEIATTRLETMLGDKAVAVHSKDPRYTHLHGKRVYHPFRKDTIPIICDDILVDMNFGTGAVKVTPAHDPNDFEVGMRHKLEFMNILTKDGKMNEECGEFSGMMRFDARLAIRKKLQDMGLYKEKKNHEMRLGLTQRGKDVVEQVVTFQWFVDTREAAAKALEILDTGEFEILPKEYEGDWRRWHQNIRPWCISRQLYWGHRIPAYLVQHADGETWIAAHDPEEAKELAEKQFKGITSIEQEKDVLDTWFSSALLPFTTNGWPNETNEFFPTSVLETGWDILTFWISRMVMMSLELTGKVPFKQALLHPLIRDAYGRKMSKSLGNVIDPLYVIDGASLEDLCKAIENDNLDEKEKERSIKATTKEYPQGIPQCGSDAMRLALSSFAGFPRTANLNINIIVNYRNFCNKIWNSVRFAMPVFEKKTDLTNLTPLDRWILKKLNELIRSIINGITKFELGDSVANLVHFYKEDFCSFYLEAIKSDIKNPERQGTVGAVLYEVIETYLRVLHPFMPYVTEDLWQRIPRRCNVESIMIAPYPQPVNDYDDADDKIIEAVNEIITAGRHLKKMYMLNVNTMPMQIVTNKNDYELFKETIKTLVGVKDITILPSGTPMSKGFASQIIDESVEVRLDLAGLVDFEKELKKAIEKQKQIQLQIEKIKKKQSNPNYSKVPENVRQGDNERLASYEQQLDLVNKNIEIYQS